MFFYPFFKFFRKWEDLMWCQNCWLRKTLLCLFLLRSSRRFSCCLCIPLSASECRKPLGHSFFKLFHLLVHTSAELHRKAKITYTVHTAVEPHRKSKVKLVILSNYKWGSSAFFNFSLSLKCFFFFCKKKGGCRWARRRGARGRAELGGGGGF